MVNWISCSNHSYLKVGSEPFLKNFCVTQILCSSLLCSGQGLCFSLKSEQDIFNVCVYHVRVLPSFCSIVILFCCLSREAFLSPDEVELSILQRPLLLTP